MVSLKKLNIEIPYDPAILLLGIYLEKNENANSKRQVHHNVHSSSIYNSQDMEATPSVHHRQMDKEDVIYMYRYIHIHHGILLNHKK